MRQKPLISIVTAVYNGEKYLEQTIQSVLNQTYKNIEYIIIDGGSTDGTIDIIKRHEDKITYWISEKDNGIYDAWNKGIRVSKGDWIGFLGADDFYLNDAIENYVNMILSAEFDLMYISGKNILCDDSSKIIKTFGKKWNWTDFRVYMNVAHVGSLHNKKLYSKYGMYDLSFKICGDYELLLRAKENLKAGFLDKETCYMRNGGVSNLSNKVFQETFKAKKLNNSRKCNALYYYDMYIAIIKYKLRRLLGY
ncbi:glycosyltransferase [Aliarcobacter cryaerophilus]|uniref:glycosyltransferase family 2 protein n=1 Tax=Aliarcobacter cryaerophilus TaxID=28198 RepID=UPI0021B5144B|nr:glycosyltransferase family 2 protein [Aliarcobacter cryaerophilus]MCT7487108.1 glycosyltransferase [Aliarcobacter cryaerophilus]MCT7491578.1 glycosyltransferase [Aliarcobacter cryaerophilus]